MPESTDIVGNTRDGWREFRDSDPLTAGLEVLHFAVEMVVVLGQLYRLLMHMAVYGIVCELRRVPEPWLRNEDVQMDHLVAPNITAGDWTAERYQRLGTAVFGLALYYQTGFYHDPNPEFWLFRIGAAYMILDPLLGVAWRLYDG